MNLSVVLRGLDGNGVLTGSKIIIVEEVGQKIKLSSSLVTPKV